MIAYIRYGLNVVQICTHYLCQDGEKRLYIRTCFNIFLWNVDMLQIRILIKMFVVYVLLAYHHYCHIKAIILLN